MGSLIRTAAIGAAGFVALSFALFATDQLEHGSTTQVKAVDGSRLEAVYSAEIDAPAPPPRVERMREAEHSGLRELIDDVNDPLVTPFTGAVSSDGVWVGRTVSAALALLLYGLGGAMLANFAPKPRRRHPDWREPSASAIQR